MSVARVLALVGVLALVFAASRAMIRALPGDPLDTLLAETGTSIPREELAAELRLDRPFLAALAEDARGALRGDFGRSVFTREPVGPRIASGLGRTALLAGASLVLGLAAAVLLGLAAATGPSTRIGRLSDAFCTLHGAVAAALPTPWIGPLLAYALAVQLPLFPIGGHLALPAITLAFAFSGLWARLIRERVRETLALGAAPGARARGVPEWKVALKYGLAPASGALAAYLGTQVGALFAGAFITEAVFDWPGMGTLLVDAVLQRDYPVVEAGVFVTAAAALVGTALGDWAQERLDPRRVAE
jgi:peptide/nickel transport system permease protein